MRHAGGSVILTSGALGCVRRSRHRHDLIQAGGFPPFFLQPINFEGLYAETLRQRQEQGDAPSLADSEPAGNA